MVVKIKYKLEKSKLRRKQEVKKSKKPEKIKKIEVLVFLFIKLLILY